MSKHLIAASILAVAAAITLAGFPTPVEAYYVYAAYPYDCKEYNPYCVLYDYPYSTYHYRDYPYWWGGGYWGGRRYYRGY